MTLPADPQEGTLTLDVRQDPQSPGQQTYPELRKPFRFLFFELTVRDHQGLDLGRVERDFTIARPRISGSLSRTTYPLRTAESCWAPSFSRTGTASAGHAPRSRSRPTPDPCAKMRI